MARAYPIGEEGIREILRENAVFERAQKRLIEYADSLEEVGIYIHRDLETLPKEYVEHVNAYLKEAAKNITLRKQVEEFELKYEKARGELFDCLHAKEG